MLSNNVSALHEENLKLSVCMFTASQLSTFFSSEPSLMVGGLPPICLLPLNENYENFTKRNKMEM